MHLLTNSNAAAGRFNMYFVDVFVVNSLKDNLPYDRFSVAGIRFYDYDLLSC